MKKQNKKTKTLTGIASILGALFIGLTISPAFGASSTSSGPYSPLDANPSFQGGACSATSTACADALSSAPEYIESFNNVNQYKNIANAWNNENSGHTSYGSSPSLLSSGTTITFSSNISYKGVIQVPSSSSHATLSYQVDGYDTNYYLGGCNFVVANSASTETGGYNLNCNYGNTAGQDNFYTGGNPQTSTDTDTIGLLAKADYWNNGGSFSINSMTICDDGTC
ncbi:MAG: hypothetical protein KGH87_02030 [Thaumarchaeota archaeon]|nr:hypothetical protein [Candidatus Nitrosotalea sp.]MDE1813227.1 hypothetical protein [Nitrososphaerota archaeon]MDE1838676.1 hypothetical protein [Nitrososphaerota archaeon]